MDILGEAININKEEEEKDNVVSLKLIEGGKDTSGTNDSDWLTPLAEGTIFLTQEKNNPNVFHLDQWQKVDDFDQSQLLVSNLNGQVRLFVPKPATRFCNKFRLHEILAIIENKEIKEENE